MMTGSRDFLLLVMTTAVLAYGHDRTYKFYPGDKPIWPVPTTCPPKDPQNSTVHLGDDNDCTKFYKCMSGKKIPMECPLADRKGNKLHFNRILQVCDWPSRAMCADGSWTTWSPHSTASTGTTVSKPTPPITVSSPTTPSSKPPPRDCRGQPDGTKIAHSDICFLYYECKNQEPQLQMCPRGFQFYSSMQSCDWPDGTCEVLDESLCPESGIIFLPHECCNRVYVCSEGNPIMLSCGMTKYWNMQIKNCTRPEEAICESGKIC